MGCCLGKKEETPDLYKNLIDPGNVTEVEAHAVLDHKREVTEGFLKKHTEYHLQINMTGAKQLTCWKRYSDFESLHMRMKLDHPAVLAHFDVELPPKQCDDTEVRRQQLEHYMCRMVASATLLWTKELNDFIGCEDGIAQQISASSKNIKDLWKQKLMREGNAIFSSGGSSAQQEDSGRSSTPRNSGRCITPTIQCNARSLSLGGAQPEPIMIEVDVIPRDPAYNQIMQMFDVRGGARIRGAFHLNRISRIENAKLRNSYKEAVSKVAVTATPNYFTPTTPVTEPRSNEALLFCSLKPDAIDSVAERGFMKVERLFGAGVYFMDNAYKAHVSSYNHCPPDMKEFTLLVAKVTLGDPCILLKENTALSTPPQPNFGFLSRRDQGAPSVYHSVLGESRDRGGSMPWREYVLYNENLAYPEYKVTYTVNE